MRLRFLATGTLAVVVVLGLAGTSGFAHARGAKTRVAIRDTGAEGVFHGKFTLALSGQSFDAGKGLITPSVGDTVIRGGQAQEPVSGSEALTGKKGILTIHFDGVAIEVATNRYAEYGTWKIEHVNPVGEGVYKSWKGGGRWASVEVNSRYHIEWDGLVTR